MRQQRDAGFGMVEVVVSIFMLGLLAIAFLPVLIQGLKTSMRNSTIATATQLVNQSIEQARAVNFADCAALDLFAGQSVTGSDANGNVLTVTRLLPSGCDAADGVPELLSVSVTSSADPGAVLASATTHVAVTP